MAPLGPSNAVSGPPSGASKCRVMLRELTLETPRALKRFPRMARGQSRRRTIHNVGMLKTMEICLFAPLGSEKNGLPRTLLDFPRTLPKLTLAPSKAIKMLRRMAWCCSDHTKLTMMACLKQWHMCFLQRRSSTQKRSRTFCGLSEYLPKHS